MYYVNARVVYLPSEIYNSGSTDAELYSIIRISSSLYNVENLTPMGVQLPMYNISPVYHKYHRDGSSSKRPEAIKSVVNFFCSADSLVVCVTKIAITRSSFPQ